VFCTVLCSKYDEKLENCQRKTIRYLVCTVTCRIRSILVCQMLELARNNMVLLLKKESCVTEICTFAESHKLCKTSSE
jgi:hypothetical protein